MTATQNPTFNATRERCKQLLAARPDLTPADIAGFTTMAPQTIRNFVNGHLEGSSDLCEQVNDILAKISAGEILQPGGDSSAIILAEDATQRVRRVAKQQNFYQTQTVKNIADVIDYCHEHSSIGLVTANYGVGKTEAVKHWRQRHQRIESLVMELDSYTGTGKVDFVRALAEQLNLPSTDSTTAGGKMFRSVVKRLREEPVLLIVDQCELARPTICQIVRQIHDRTHDAGVGVAMLGAPVMLERMRSGRIADLEALRSRISIFATLTGCTRAEVAAIVKQEGITDVEDAAFDLWSRAVAGSMRRLMKSIDLLKAKHAGRRVTERTIAGVAGSLWGMNIQGVA